MSRNREERELQGAIVDTAKLLGWLAYHTFDSRRSERGFPDLVLAHPRTGRLVFAELKSAKGVVSAEQAAWIEALVKAAVECNLHDYAANEGGAPAHGVKVYVWRPEDWRTGEIEQVLKEGARR